MVIFYTGVLYNGGKSLRLREKEVHISLTTSRKNVSLEGILNKLCLDSKRFGLHSLRGGGATSAGNLGVSTYLFQKHG